MAGGFVDLRSDTVTSPTAAMRRAMAEAEVGDDAYGEDPTVNALQEMFAARVGKEAALYVPSGTMANQIALRVLAAPGSSVIAGRRQHVVLYENGAAALNARVQFHLVDDDDGTIDPDAIAWAVEAAVHHQPPPALVCVEDTHMPADGAPWPIECLRAVGEAAAAAGLPVHLDGARLFNAEVATGVGAAERAACATTVMCCLSKGLCAPVGSVLAGSAEVIARARGERARLGGQMRQAGVIAAAGIVALETMVDRLADDHARARRLAEVVAERWPGSGPRPAWPERSGRPAWPERSGRPAWPERSGRPAWPERSGRPEDVSTNCVTFRHPEARALLDHLRSEGVLAGTIAPATVRLMTHHDVDDDGVERAAKALAGSPV